MIILTIILCWFFTSYPVSRYKGIEMKLNEHVIDSVYARWLMTFLIPFLVLAFIAGVLFVLVAVIMTCAISSLWIVAHIF